MYGSTYYRQMFAFYFLLAFSTYISYDVGVLYVYMYIYLVLALVELAASLPQALGYSN